MSLVVLNVDHPAVRAWVHQRDPVALNNLEELTAKVDSVVQENLEALLVHYALGLILCCTYADHLLQTLVQAVMRCYKKLVDCKIESEQVKKIIYTNSKFN